MCVYIPLPTHTHTVLGLNLGLERLALHSHYIPSPKLVSFQAAFQTHFKLLSFGDTFPMEASLAELMLHPMGFHRMSSTLPSPL
jgi:hypothetical protein